MKKELINTIEQGMLGILNNEQLAKLHEVLEFSFAMFAENYEETQYSNDELLKLFLSAKQVEGCSERSLKYYRTTLSKMNEKINKSVRQIETNDIRTYISNYENETSAGKVTLDNIRRIISSFFAWLEDENYIVKSPARRIHKIRVGKTVKDVYSDEELERMRDSCNNSRDLAIIDILSSTGIRVGELVNLNISDIDLEKRRVFYNNNEIILTTKEYDLLVYFLNNKGLAISREQVLSKVWDENYFGSDRVVDDTLRRLRKKMPEINIRTIYGFGYRLD